MAPHDKGRDELLGVPSRKDQRPGRDRITGSSYPQTRHDRFGGGEGVVRDDQGMGMTGKGDDRVGRPVPRRELHAANPAQHEPPEGPAPAVAQVDRTEPPGDRVPPSSASAAPATVAAVPTSAAAKPEPPQPPTEWSG